MNSHFCYKERYKYQVFGCNILVPKEVHIVFESMKSLRDTNVI